MLSQKEKNMWSESLEASLSLHTIIRLFLWTLFFWWHSGEGWGKEKLRPGQTRDPREAGWRGFSSQLHHLLILQEREPSLMRTKSCMCSFFQVEDAIYKPGPPGLSHVEQQSCRGVSLCLSHLRGHRSLSTWNGQVIFVRRYLLDLSLDVLVLKTERGL